MPNYEHDWEDADFAAHHYAVGDRSTLDTVADIPAPRVPEVSSDVVQSVVPVTHTKGEVLDYDDLDNPADDPIFLCDPPDEMTTETFDIVDGPGQTKTKRFGRSTLYSTSDLRDLVMNTSREQRAA